MFEFNREKVECGDFSSTRTDMKNKIYKSMAIMVFLLAVLSFPLIKLPALPNSELFKAEKFWLISWTTSVFIGNLTLFLAALLAYQRPTILLNDNWQKYMYRIR